MFEITEVRKAPRNTAESAEEAAHEASLALGVFCFGDYNDVLHHECIYITNAPSRKAYEAGIESYLREA